MSIEEDHYVVYQMYIYMFSLKGKLVQANQQLSIESSVKENCCPQELQHVQERFVESGIHIFVRYHQKIATARNWKHQYFVTERN